MSSVKRKGNTPARSSNTESENRTTERRQAERVRTFFQGLFKIVVAVSTLGASFTFSLILTDIRSPSHPIFGVDQLIFFLALSWLLFIIALTMACVFTLLLNFWGDKAIEGFYTESKWHWAGFVMCVSLFSLLVGAFVYVCLVITAYQERIGITSLCFVGGVWILGITIAIVRLVVYLRHIRKGGQESNAV